MEGRCRCSDVNVWIAGALKVRCGPGVQAWRHGALELWKHDVGMAVRGLEVSRSCSDVETWSHGAPEL